MGARLFRNFWFERSIFIFGYITGVVAIGITLLRVVDPEMKSKTLDDFGTAFTLQSVIELFVVTLIPIFTVSYGCMATGIGLAIPSLLLLVICAKLYGVNRGPLTQPRPGEAEALLD